ncbi:hypothetical protein ACOSQ3_012896 [Xanthoceras sorbifolium]
MMILNSLQSFGGALGFEVINWCVEGPFPADEVVPWCRSFLAELQSSRSSSVKTSSVDVLRRHVWHPPEGPLLKINCDAVVSCSTGLVGFGVVIRDQYGVVLLSAAKSRATTMDPCTTKASAIPLDSFRDWLAYRQYFEVEVKS